MNTERRRQLTEAVIHPILKQPFTLWEEPPHSGNVVVDGPAANSFYMKDEVLKLGLGDFTTGVLRIGRAVYESSSNYDVGETRCLQEELEG